MSQIEGDLLKLLLALRDANAMTVEAINAYLASKAPVEAKVENMAELFPKDLQAMLNFEETPDEWKIKLRQYLGSEAFAKIAVIVKERGGTYVSAGKESHFRLPKTALE